jgi:hypothetical protein
MEHGIMHYWLSGYLQTDITCSKQWDDQGFAKKPECGIVGGNKCNFKETN